ncbi:glycosyltransferase family protein [Oribacterium sp. WCC10]|uniref:glycosyltransferase family protein n=1 Tax=Oribacterium sp. WCC10 TaxID=1855343 RepID=UPI0008E0AE3B|nr:glycosyltransferase family protein [Oribacterium sp. WCC10]SFG24153.1 hypothetical protein SAMN05216356_10423 [Oribacterium sp. WCC10]
MNDKEFCFIICTNDELFLNECLIFISDLYIPEGFSIDIITIKGAVSMTSGYNEGMRSSKAKYKIYMHQDVFILNKYFLINLLNIFNCNPSIGMIGMIGAPELNKEAIMWSVLRFGCIMTKADFNLPYESELCDNPGSSFVVKVIDGLLMATCVDIPWREDIFDGWDFYDCSQSMEFARKGYKIVVPEQKSPWVLHDDGVALSLLNYNHYRKIFIEEYKKELPD